MDRRLLIFITILAVAFALVCLAIAAGTQLRFQNDPTQQPAMRVRVEDVIQWENGRPALIRCPLCSRTTEYVNCPVCHNLRRLTVRGMPVELY